MGIVEGIFELGEGGVMDAEWLFLNSVKIILIKRLSSNNSTYYIWLIQFTSYFFINYL